MNICSWSATINDSGEGWFPIIGSSVLFKREKNGNVLFAGSLASGNNINAASCIVNTFSYNGRIYFFSRFQADIWIIDEATLEISHIHYYEKDMSIASVSIVGSKALILPGSFAYPVIVFDLQSKIVSEIPWRNNPYSGDALFICPAIHEKYIYSVTRRCDDIYVMRLGADTYEAEFHKLDARMANCICEYNDDLLIYALRRDGGNVIVQYNFENDEVKKYHEIHDLKTIDSTGRLWYFQIFACGERIYFIPSTERCIYVYDMKVGRGDFLVYPKGLEFASNSRDELVYTDSERIGNVVYLFPHGFKQIVTVDLSDSHIELTGFQINRDAISGMLSSMAEEGNIINESQSIDLSDFVIGI